MEITKCRVSDKDGNPIIVSAVLVGFVSDARRALLDTQDYGGYVRGQAAAVIRQTLLQYPFESSDDTPSIRNGISLIYS